MASTIITQLNQCLQERKVVCLATYLDFLSNEEEFIRAQYQNILDEHDKKHPCTQPADYYCDNLTISLSDNFGHSKPHPLGELKISPGEETLFSNISKPTFKFNVGEMNDFEKTLAQLTEGLKKMEVDLRIHKEPINVTLHLPGKKHVQSSVSSLGQGNVPEVRKRTIQEGSYVTLQSNMEKDKLTKKDKKILVECMKLLEQEGFTYVENLIRQQENEKLKLILEAKRDIISMCNIDGDGRAVVHCAVEHKNMEALKLLVGCGASLDVESKYGETPLHFAVIYNNIEGLQWLLQQRVQLINRRNCYGDTALHSALEYILCYELSYIKALLEHGADIHAANNYDGESPLDYARKYGYTECVKEMQKSCTCTLCR